MANSPATSELILAVARRVVAERGPDKLTLSAVAAAAGVSRPTIYRWFPTKTILLAAMTAYEVEQFDAGLGAVVVAHRTPIRRLDAALRYLVTYLDGRLGPDPIGADPAFAPQSLADSLGPHVEAFAHSWATPSTRFPPCAGSISRAQAAEVFLRLAYSHYLVPSADPDELLVVMRRFAGVAVLSRRCRRGRWRSRW